MHLTEQLTAIKAEAAKRSLKSFVKDFWSINEPTTPFIDGIHIDAICDHLQNIDQIGNLLICVPPGFAKSLLVDVFFFCWRWVTHPEERFLYASHALSLAIRDSLKCRRILESDLFKSYYPNLFAIRADQDTKQRFENDKTGFRLCSSVDGHVTGERADHAIADDPHNVKEIDSKAKRESVINWYATAFSNRVVPQKHQRIIVMQRSHAEDLAGSIIKNDMVSAWTKLVIPLEAGKARTLSTLWDDPRPEGELLCPALFSVEKAEEQKRQSGSRAYQAQYNQNPAPVECALLNPDLFKFYSQPPEGALRIVAVDLAISLAGDYTVAAVADITRDGAIYLLHMIRERMPGPRIVPTLKAIHEEFRPHVVYVEDVAFQRLIIQEARAQGLPVMGVKPEGDKVSRSIPLQIKLELGQFYLPENKSYNADILDECGAFPNSTHDDIVDALSYLAIQANLLYRRMPAPQEILSQEERQRRDEEEFRKRVREDEERLKTAFFEGL